jgi:crotonobetainyl-CoA:carnitine CoA-transferase CaiB-like acyl-CoA transferase
MKNPVYQVLNRLAEETEGSVELIDGNGSLDFLQAIYRSAEQPMNRRARAAIAALLFEHPKLSVTANVGPNINFAARLERAIIIARPELEKDRRFATARARSDNSQEVADIVEAWLKSFPSREAAIAALENERIPCAPVLTLNDAMPSRISSSAAPFAG